MGWLQLPLAFPADVLGPVGESPGPKELQENAGFPGGCPNYPGLPPGYADVCSHGTENTLPGLHRCSVCSPDFGVTSFPAPGQVAPCRRLPWGAGGGGVHCPVGKEQGALRGREILDDVLTLLTGSPPIPEGEESVIWLDR